MEKYHCHKSWGYVMQPEDWWLMLAIDAGLVSFYHWLSLRHGLEVAKGSKSGPHISLVKGHRPPKAENWRKWLNKKINFEYSNVIRYDNDLHVWLDVEPAPFNELREDLGLKPFKSFHITLGRLKYAPKYR